MHNVRDTVVQRVLSGRGDRLDVGRLRVLHDGQLIDWGALIINGKK